jgi:myo-inositol-1(or 4)-monophosphatase
MQVDILKVVEVVRKTRSMSLPSFGNVDIKAYKSVSEADAVTQIDLDIETFLKAELKVIYPDIPFVGEEFGGDKSASTFWLVDPIDGTAHYIRGIPFSTTMLALIKDGSVLLSIIYDFVNDIAYYAERGNGAYKNGEKITVSDRDIQHAYISCEINSLKEENKVILSEIRKRAPQIVLRSSGYEYVLVATGKIEARITYDPFCKDHDCAPGALLVEEAGGIVRNFNKESYDYTNLSFYAGNPRVYKVLVEAEEGIPGLS